MISALEQYNKIYSQARKAEEIFDDVLSPQDGITKKLNIWDRSLKVVTLTAQGECVHYGDTLGRIIARISESLEGKQIDQIEYDEADYYTKLEIHFK